MNIPELGKPPAMQISPWVIELNGGVNVRRVDQMRVLEVVHPSGVLAARIVLDPIAAASIARELSPSPNGVAET